MKLSLLLHRSLGQPEACLLLATPGAEHELNLNLNLNFNLNLEAKATDALQLKLRLHCS